LAAAREAAARARSFEPSGDGPSGAVGVEGAAEAAAGGEASGYPPAAMRANVASLELQQQQQRRLAELERALASARQELNKERERSEEARMSASGALAELRQSHADELLRHANELSVGAEALAQRDAELDTARWEAAQAMADAEHQLKSMEEAWKTRLAAAFGEARQAKEAALREKELSASSAGQGDSTVEAADLRKELELARGKAAESEGELRRRLEDVEGALESARRELQTESAAFQKLQGDGQQQQQQHQQDSSTAPSDAEAARREAIAQIEELWQRRLSEAHSELNAHRAESCDERKRAIADALAQHERSKEEMEEAHAGELRRLEALHREALGRRDDEISMARLEVQCTQDEVGRQVNLAAEQWQHKFAQAEEQLKAVTADLAAERERADRQSVMDNSMLDTSREELSRRDAEHDQLLQQRDAEIEKLKRRMLEDSEETDRSRSEADGWRHMLMKITGDLNSKNDEIALEREKAGKAVADCEREKANLRQSHAEEIARLERTHTEALSKRDSQINSAWQDTQIAREAAERQRTETERYVADMQRAHADELTRLGWENAEALSKKDAEVDRAQQQVQLVRDEAHFQRAEAEEVWRQRCAEAESNLMSMREELARMRDQLTKVQSEHSTATAKLKRTHAEELAHASQDHTQTLALRDAELARLRKEMQYDRDEAERRRSELEKVWQQKLSEVENALKAARADSQQERERMTKAQAELENALGDIRNKHALELTKVHTNNANELAHKETEIEGLKRDLQHEREEGERLCSTVDDAWRSRLADAEKDFELLRSELRNEREATAKVKSEGSAAITELKEANARELTRLAQEHSGLVAKKEAEWDSKHRAAQLSRDRAERERAEAEETLQRKIAEAEADLAVARQAQTREQERASKLQAECRRSVTELEQAQADEVSRLGAEHARSLQRRDAELEQARIEAKSEQEEAAKQETESQEAWRWLSRVEGDLKTAQRELRQERELAAAAQAAGETSSSELRRTHAAQLARLNAEHTEAIAQRQGEVAAIRKDLQEARQEAKRKLTEAEDSWGKRLTRTEAEAEADRSSLQDKLSAILQERSTSEQQLAECRQARGEIEEMRQQVEQNEVWQRRIAEAEARGAAGVDLATRAKVDGQRAQDALKACRRELEEEQHCAQELQEQIRSSAEGLRKACAVAAQAELVAEQCKVEELRMQADQSRQQRGPSQDQSEQVWRSVAQGLESEVANLRVELQESHGQVWRSPARGSPGSPTIKAI